MAESVQETKPPEPPPKPPEVPKPAARATRAEAETPAQPQESQQSAHENSRNAARSEHAKATGGGTPDGLRPTPEFQQKLDNHTVAKNGPGGLTPTPEFQEKLDAHTAARSDRGTTAPQDTSTTPQPQDAALGHQPQDSSARQQPPDSSAVQPGHDLPTSQGPANGERNVSMQAGEQSGEQAATREAASAERAKAMDGPALSGEVPAPRSVEDITPQNNPLPEAGTSPLDSQKLPDLHQPPESPFPPAPDPLNPTRPGEQPTAPELEEPGEQPTVPDPEQPSGQVPEVVDESDSQLPDVEQAAEHESDTEQSATGDQRPASEQFQEQSTEQQTESSAGNTETDRSAETAARLDELRHEGHGPQRHHDPTDEQLAARMGDPVIDPDTGQPVLKENGHVLAKDHIDPMTGTTVDGVHGGVHRCGDYATRMDSPEDYVDADRYLREQIGESGPAAIRRPISEVLGPDAHGRMTGYYHDPDSAGNLKPVDFTGGTVFAVYERLPDGDLKLRTMYVDPAPNIPDQ